MERFLRKIHRLYGGWPRRLVTDWGFWYRRVSVVRTESMCGWHEVVEGLFTQLKRKLASFAGYCPRGIKRMREWIWAWAGFYNLSNCCLG